MASRVVSAALAALLALGASAPALAGPPVDLDPGQPAPRAGRLYDDQSLEKIAQFLREGDDARALVETLQAALEALRAENADLRGALDAAKKENEGNREALIRADEREKLRAESVALLREALAEYKSALKEAREESRALRKQAAIDRVLGAIPLVGLVFLLFGFGR